MKHKIKAAIPLLAAALLLAGCGGSDKADPPEDYSTGAGSLPSLSKLVALGEDSQFRETQDEEAGTVTYVYSQLASGSQTAQDYTQSLEQDYNCRILENQETGGTPNFSAPSGQAVAAQESEDSDDVLLLTIQWEETSCSVTPSQGTKEDLPQSKSESMTLDDAVNYMKSLSPSFLGLSGSSMDQYTILPQDGTVMLNDELCLCLNVYNNQNHRFEQSYLLTVPDRNVYQLDRETGQATPLN